jgi:hypothetical protein
VKESEIQRAILDYLAACGILAFRMNTGAMRGEYKGKTWFMRFGAPGMADILAFPNDKMWLTPHQHPVLWIEVKAEKGNKQSDLQQSFQRQVEARGHRYVVARSIDDVEAAFLRVN